MSRHGIRYWHQRSPQHIVLQSLWSLGVSRRALSSGLSLTVWRFLNTRSCSPSCCRLFGLVLAGAGSDEI